MTDTVESRGLLKVSRYENIPRRRPCFDVLDVDFLASLKVSLYL